MTKKDFDFRSNKNVICIATGGLHRKKLADVNEVKLYLQYEIQNQKQIVNVISR